MKDLEQGVEMIALVVRHLDFFIDGIQILLCLLMVMYLFWNRSEYKKLKRVKTEIGAGHGFNTEVIMQTTRQEIDRAFANIIETITDEQDRLENVLQSGRRKDEAFGISEFQIQPQFASKSIRSSPNSEPKTGDNEKHLRIQNLALGGMSAKQISEKLKTPLGEVELVLDLRNEGS
jgi:hypothetical protein